MNLRLYVSKKDYARDYSQRGYIRFAVIDLDKSKKYPANYVCMLPMQPSINGKVKNIFSELFGKDSLELAKTLLTKALKAESDVEIKTEIERRLELLKPKQPIQVKCRICGNSFEPRGWNIKRKICQECRQKTYNNQ